MRTSIAAHERQTATLWFFAMGRYYECLKYSTIISPQDLGKIVPEICDTICNVLKGMFVQFPDSAEEWKVVTKTFEDRWNFPHCLGVIDGKHVDTVPPANSGSFYFNYKGRHSVVLLTIVDANHRFLLVDFGSNGRVSDGGVLQSYPWLVSGCAVSRAAPRHLEEEVPITAGVIMDSRELAPDAL
ncbi:putative nuclease HARBI1 [Schistocerca americana]|uniref:putative nuclease HARBI1 n=1 Tax=Schistocerca americana TaxID=7009 RepID=UPI001F4F3632|nr:putative nuclease HARBI1 [Schistocerca americana]